MKQTGHPLPDGRALLGGLALALFAPACGGGSAAFKDAAAASDGGAGGRTSPALGLFCSPGVDPAEPLIANFSAATFNVNRGRWGGAENLTLFVYDYHDPDSPDSSSSRSLDGEVFTFSGQVVPSSGASYAGGGMHFDSCLNTTTYRGVQFTLTGTSGGCTVYFDLETYAQQPLNERGGCASYCYQFPRVVVTPRSAPITLLFSQLEGTGIPSSAAAMAREIMGMRWQLESASGQGDAGQADCTFSLTVDDVKLVK